MTSRPGSSNSNSLSPPLAVSPPTNQPMRLSVNPTTGVLELVPVHGGGGQQLVVSVAPGSSGSSSGCGVTQQHNVVNIAPRSGTSSVVNIKSGGSGQSGSNMHVVVEVKEEHPADQRPVILSLGGGGDSQEIPIEELCRLESMNGLLSAIQNTELTDLQQLQAQQVKALFPGLAGVCPQFIARIQKAAGPLFQAHLQQQQLQEQLEQELQDTKPEPALLQPVRRPSPLAPLSIKPEPDKSCILIESDEDEADPIEHKPKFSPPSASIPESDDLKLEDLSVEIGTTSRSRPCLKLRGYTYYQNRKFNDTVYWLCCEARDIKCKGKVTTDNYRIVKLYENHNHPNEDGHVSQPVVVSLGQKPPHTYISDKSSSKQRRESAGALRASIASKRRRRASSSDTSPPPPPPRSTSTALCDVAQAAAAAATPTSHPHMSLFPSVTTTTSTRESPSPPGSLCSEYITLSEYEDLLDLELEDLARMPCVQEVVEEYHEWHVINANHKAHHQQSRVNTSASPSSSPSMSSPSSFYDFLASAAGGAGQWGSSH